MKITQKERDALLAQLILLYRDLPGSHRLVQEQDLKDTKAVTQVLTRLNDEELPKVPVVELTALKFAILAILYKKISSLSKLDNTINEADIELELSKNYKTLYSMTSQSNKSPTEILAQHRNTISKLFCQGGVPRSLSLFGDWITKSTKGTALDPEDFTNRDSGDEESYFP